MSNASPDTSFGLASRLRDARKAAILSQAELAKRLDVSLRTLQNWEAGVLPQPRHRRRALDFIAAHEEVVA